MNADLIVALVVGVLGVLLGGGATGLVIFLIQRKDNKENQFKEILKRLDAIEGIQHEQQLSELRTELSIHLLHHKKDKITIMRIAEKYFKELKGDFYMTSKFCEWLRKMHLPKPDWFDPEH